MPNDSAHITSSSLVLDEDRNTAKGVVRYGVHNHSLIAGVQLSDNIKLGAARESKRIEGVSRVVFEVDYARNISVHDSGLREHKQDILRQLTGIPVKDTSSYIVELENPADLKNALVALKFPDAAQDTLVAKQHEIDESYLRNYPDNPAALPVSIAQAAVSRS